MNDNQYSESYKFLKKLNGLEENHLNYSSKYLYTLVNLGKINEAFNYAKSNVEAWYEEQGRLASEHAGLDDNGDSLFALEPTVDVADGRLAEIAYIDVFNDSSEGMSARAVELKGRMQEIERSVFILRGRKAEFLEADYWQQLQELLVDLARTTGQFNEQVE